MNTIPMTASEVVERYFLEVRAKLLEIAAVLDRVDRADGAPADDARLRKVNEALSILQEPGSNRAERIQLLFSREYDPNWLVGFRVPRSGNGSV